MILLKLRDGLLLAILTAARWGILIGFCFLLTMTTTPLELTWSLRILLNPLTRIGFPVYDLSVMAGLTLYFLPVLKDEVDRLLKVKKVQGLSNHSSGFFQRVYNIITLVPLLLERVLRRSESIALAMEARGYSDKKAGRSKIIKFYEPLSRKDFGAVFSIIIYLTIIWGLYRFFIRGGP